jgi:hypothetical protein
LAELLAALDARDIARAHAAVERLRDDASPDEQRGRLARIGELFIAADSVPGAARLDAIQDALAAETFQPGAPIEPLWFRWLQRLAEHPDTRPAAIEILDRPWIGEPIYEPLRLHALARALELEADTARARALYLRYIAIMAAADDGLPIEGTIEAARAALARIGS